MKRHPLGAALTISVLAIITALLAIFANWAR